MIDERLIRFGLETDSKDDAILKVASLLDDTGRLSDKDTYIRGVYERGKEFATGIGMHIAIPHCKSSAMKQTAFTLVRLNGKIDWGSFSGLLVNYIIMLAAPDGGDNAHLTMLSILARNLMGDDFRTGLLEAESANDIKGVFREKGEQAIFIVCVTARPMEIAHTYMVATDLEKAVKKAGHEVKVETQGAQGLENEITPEDLKRTNAAIIASDIHIKDGSRFSDVPTLTVGVQEAVKDPDGIIKELMEALE